MSPNHVRAKAICEEFCEPGTSVRLGEESITFAAKGVYHSEISLRVSGLDWEIFKTFTLSGDVLQFVLRKLETEGT